MDVLLNTAVTHNEICRICLSTDRTLTPLGKYLELLRKLCPKLKPAYKTEELLICWECQALLFKVEKFQQKVQTAQNFFKNVSRSVDRSRQVSDQGNPNLSTLQTVLNTEINYTFISSNTETSEKTNEKPPEVVQCEDIKKELDIDNSYSEQYDEILNDKVEKVEDSIKDEKIDFNKEFLNKIGHFLEDDEDITEFKDELDNDDYPDLKEAKKVKKRTFSKKFNIKKIRRPYRVVYGDRKKHPKGNFKSEFYNKVDIDEAELRTLLEKERTMHHFTKMAYRCNLCAVGYPLETTYDRHMEKHDPEKGKLKCPICSQRFNKKKYLDHHVECHMFKFECQLCDVTFLRKYNVLQHIKNAHEKAYECVDCGKRYQTKSELFEHYKVHKEFICDHCGKRALKKHVLERHIRVSHLPHVCKICNITFSKHRILHSHNMQKHVKTRTEEAFCVECNIQFDNVPTFKRHLSTSVKHRPKSDVKYPCPECNKLFNKKMSMKYHYAYFHTDRTKFYCEECAKYFLNNYQLRRHKAVFHLKIKPPKNKFCPHCGRGFSERRVLENHIRTHTGERPFVCALCSAAFTQAYPLTTHMRAVHKLARLPLHHDVPLALAAPAEQHV